MTSSTQRMALRPVEQFVAVDPEGQDVDWRLSGDDISDFSITGGSLTFNSPPDFEAPSDFGSNNVYDVTVGASDPGGRLTWIDVTVTVTNVDEAGTVTLSTDRPGEGIPLNAQLTDPDRISSTIRMAVGPVRQTRMVRLAGPTSAVLAQAFTRRSR